jgi:hypothetical protein
MHIGPFLPRSQQDREGMVRRQGTSRCPTT